MREKIFILIFVFSALAIVVNPSAAEINIIDADAAYDTNLSAVTIPTNPSSIKTIFLFDVDAALNECLYSTDVPTSISPLNDIFLINTDATTSMCLSCVQIPTEVSSIKYIFIHGEDAKANIQLISSNEITNQPPIASFSYYPRNPVVGEQIGFDSSSSWDPDGSIISYFWSFGNGEESTIQNPFHTYYSVGEFTVELTVTDDKNTTTTNSAILYVNANPPIVYFTYQPANPSTADIIQFNASYTAPDSEIITWSWDFGDGGKSNLKNPMHQYICPGTYLVNHTVTDSNNMSSSCSKYIFINNQKPIVNFSYNPSDPSTQDKIQFVDLSFDFDGNLSMWYWDFTDGFTSSMRNPSHKYGDDGTYIVTLSVTDDYGETNITEKAVTVKNTPPLADFKTDPAEPVILETTCFIDLSIDPDGKIVDWLWEFEDNVSNNQNPQYQFLSKGNFLITLTVRDDDGATNTTTKKIFVNSKPPDCNFTYSPENPTDLQTVSFTDTSTDEEGTIVSWCWGFGDGGTSTEQNPTHQYADNGIYYVNLTVTNNNGASNICQKSIVVNNVCPAAKFTFSPGKFTIQFTDLSEDLDGYLINWTWDFGEGNMSYDQNPEHRYGANGIYMVKLTIKDDDGDMNHESKEITVSNVPVKPSVVINHNVSQVHITEEGNDLCTVSISILSETPVYNATLEFLISDGATVSGATGDYVEKRLGHQSVFWLGNLSSGDYKFFDISLRKTDKNIDRVGYEIIIRAKDGSYRFTEIARSSGNITINVLDQDEEKYDAEQNYQSGNIISRSKQSSTEGPFLLLIQNNFVIILIFILILLSIYLLKRRR